jgi:hypothetical protein
MKITMESHCLTPPGGRRREKSWNLTALLLLEGGDENNHGISRLYSSRREEMKITKESHCLTPPGGRKRK